MSDSESGKDSPKTPSPVPSYILPLQIGNVLAYLVMIILNIVSSVVGFGGNTNGSISRKYPTAFTPAGYMFSIWGVIFVALLGFTIFQALPMNRVANGIVQRVSFALIINFILNGIWNVIFAYEVFWLSVVFIVVMLLTTIFVYVRLGIGREIGVIDIWRPCLTLPSEVDEDLFPNSRVRDGLLRFWFAEFPFSIYLAWLSVATIANISILLVSLGIPTTAYTWSIVMQAVAVVLASAMLITALDITYAIVIATSLIAIAANQAAYPSVVAVAYALAGLTYFFAFVAFVVRIVKSVMWVKKITAKSL